MGYICKVPRPPEMVTELFQSFEEIWPLLWLEIGKWHLLLDFDESKSII